MLSPNFILTDECLPVCVFVCVCRGSGVRAVSLEDTIADERNAFKEEKNRCHPSHFFSIAHTQLDVIIALLHFLQTPSPLLLFYPPYF